jgi:hypothetical protein
MSSLLMAGLSLLFLNNKIHGHFSTTAEVKADFSTEDLKRSIDRLAYYIFLLISTQPEGGPFRGSTSVDSTLGVLCIVSTLNSTKKSPMSHNRYTHPTCKSMAINVMSMGRSQSSNKISELYHQEIVSQHS